MARDKRAARDAARLAAAQVFRGVFDPDRLAGLRGHPLHGALIQAFPKQRAALHDFRRYLGPIRRIRLTRAWRRYHGGDEKYPDFVPYYVHDDGPQLLLTRLTKLRNLAHET